MHLIALGIALILAAPIVGQPEPKVEPLQSEVEVKEEPPSPAKRLTWRDNPNDCDLKTQWVRKDNLKCLDKAEPTTPSAPAPKVAGNIQQIVHDAAIKHGLDPSWFWNLALCESGGNPSSVNYNYWEDQNGTALGSGGTKYHPSGLYQHLTNYWPARAIAHGYAGASVFDPVANANVTASMWKGGSHLWECQ